METKIAFGAILVAPLLASARIASQSCPHAEVHKIAAAGQPSVRSRTSGVLNRVQ
jgi:hypothetical protein